MGTPKCEKAPLSCLPGASRALLKKEENFEPCHQSRFIYIYIFDDLKDTCCCL